MTVIALVILALALFGLFGLFVKQADLEERIEGFHNQFEELYERIETERDRSTRLHQLAAKALVAQQNALDLVLESLAP